MFSEQRRVSLCLGGGAAHVLEGAGENGDAAECRVFDVPDGLSGGGLRVVEGVSDGVDGG